LPLLCVKTILCFIQIFLKKEKKEDKNNYYWWLIWDDGSNWFFSSVHFWIYGTYQKWIDMYSSEILGVELGSIIRFIYILNTFWNILNTFWKNIVPIYGNLKKYSNFRKRNEYKLQTFLRLCSHYRIVQIKSCVEIIKK
jgi:hypothetical protein